LKALGEWHQHKLHGTGKITDDKGNIYWGEFNDNKREAYGIFEYADGKKYIG
jgi:hypothetical protein